MISIVIEYQGKTWQQLSVEPGRTITLGRSSRNDIRLADEPGISREHARLSFLDASVRIEMLSKYGIVTVAGEEHNEIELPLPAKFHIGAFQVEVIAEASAQADVSHALATVTPTAASYSSSSFDESDAGGFEMTKVVTFDGITPYLVIKAPNQSQPQTLKLEGAFWTVGRDPSCDITLEHPAISRQHFEIQRTDQGFELRDLQSANGTHINTRVVAPGEWRPVQSGDRITIRDLELTFEMRDEKFKDRVEDAKRTLQQLPSVVEAPVDPNPLVLMPNEPQRLSLPTAAYDGPAVVKINPAGHPASGRVKTQTWLTSARAMIIGGGLIVISLLASIGPTQKKPKQDVKVAGLSQEEQDAIEASYVLAQNFSVSGKYLLCKEEIKKIHNKVPLYKDSKAILEQCHTGDELQIQERRLEEERQARIKAESEGLRLLAECDTLLKNQKSDDMINDCLARVMDIYPSAPGIIRIEEELRLRADRKEQEKNRRLAYQRRLAAGQTAFARAKQLEESGKLKAAIDAYKDYLAGQHPDPQQYRAQAQQKISDLASTLDRKIASSRDECNKLYNERKYRAAVAACDQILKEDPSNQEAIELRREIASHLEKYLQAIWEESIFEEALGTVEPAKEKWRKILEEDLPDGTYRGPATSKLQKYP